jgi:hypothetical protein
MTFWQPGQAVVIIFSAAGESIRETCHAVLKIAINHE